MVPEGEKLSAERRADLLQLAAAARDQPATESIGTSLLLFVLAGESYGFPLDRVREVVKLAPIAPVPFIPAHILGVINLRGEILPVLDPRRLLGLLPASPGPRGLIVVVKASTPVGFLADEVQDVVEVRGSVDPPLATLPERQAAYLQGQIVHDGRLIGVLDVEALLAGGGEGG